MGKRKLQENGEEKMEDGTCSDIEIDFQRRGKKLQKMERDEVRAVEGVESGRGREGGNDCSAAQSRVFEESYDWQSHACGVCVHTSHCTAADTHTHIRVPVCHMHVRSGFITVSVLQNDLYK